MMAFLYRCPYYTSEDPGVVRCEVASLKFPNRAASLWYRKMFCGSFDYSECTLAMLMNAYYEEYFEEDEDDGREEESLGEDEQVGSDL